MDQEGGHVIFGECKYQTSEMGVDVLRNLELKARQVEWKKSVRKEHFILFFINGFSDELTKLSKTRKDLILMS